MFDPHTYITLLIPDPDLRPMPYVIIELDEAWVAHEDSPLVLPKALALYRSRLAAGERLVTRERTTTSQQSVPP